MKKGIVKFCLVAGISMMMSSCYVYEVQVGKGAQSGATVQKMNHYLFWGLAPVGVSDPKAMAGDAENYTVINKHRFVDGLLQGLTFGIYSPTTTIVQK